MRNREHFSLVFRSAYENTRGEYVGSHLFLIRRQTSIDGQKTGPAAQTVKNPGSRRKDRMRTLQSHFL